MSSIYFYYYYIEKPFFPLTEIQKQMLVYLT